MIGARHDAVQPPLTLQSTYRLLVNYLMGAIPARLFALPSPVRLVSAQILVKLGLLCILPAYDYFAEHTDGTWQRLAEVIQPIVIFMASWHTPR